MIHSNNWINHINRIYVYKLDLALNDIQWVDVIKPNQIIGDRTYTGL